MSAKKTGIHLLVISAVAAALVFGGIQFINAQQIKTHVKPVKPDPVDEPQWKANVSGMIYGDSDFMPGDFTQVEVNEPDGGDYYGFYLRLTGYPCLHFSGISINPSCIEPGEGVPCGFPGLTEGCLGAPECIACFMNNNTHPAEGYNGMLLRYLLPADILDNLNDDEFASISGVGYLHISFYSEYGYEVPPDDVTGYHNLYSFTTSENLMVTKTTDGWTIEFNQPLEDLVEEYTMEYTDYSKKRPKTYTKLVHPLTVDTNPIHFTMIWTKL